MDKEKNNFNIGGRPKLCSEFTGEEKERCLYENLRNKEFKIRLTAYEKDILLKKYETYLSKNNFTKRDLKFNKFLLNIILEVDFKNIYQKNNISKLSFDINKIGININQIAKKMNSFNNLNNHFIMESLDNISKKLNSIYKLLDQK